MSNFNREGRYIVIKLTDAEALTQRQKDTLYNIETKIIEHRFNRGKEALKCVVVESDWPEYEPTFKDIEARMTGKPTQADTIERLEAEVKRVTEFYGKTPMDSFRRIERLEATNKELLENGDRLLAVADSLKEEKTGLKQEVTEIRSIYEESESAEMAVLKAENAALKETCRRAKHAIQGLINDTPLRDLDETLEEIDAAMGEKP